MLSFSCLTFLFVVLLFHLCHNCINGCSMWSIYVVTFTCIISKNMHGNIFSIGRAKVKSKHMIFSDNFYAMICNLSGHEEPTYCLFLARVRSVLKLHSHDKIPLKYRHILFIWYHMTVTWHTMALRGQLGYTFLQKGQVGFGTAAGISPLRIATLSPTIVSFSVSRFTSMTQKCGWGSVRLEKLTRLRARLQHFMYGTYAFIACLPKGSIPM